QSCSCSSPIIVPLLSPCSASPRCPRAPCLTVELPALPPCAEPCRLHMSPLPRALLPTPYASPVRRHSPRARSGQGGGESGGRGREAVGWRRRRCRRCPREEEMRRERERTREM